jgi:hypothetical protein
MHISRIVRNCLLVVVVSMVELFHPDVSSAQQGPNAVEPGPLRSVAATRVQKPPTLDGRDDDEVWRTAQLITGFRVVRPSEDAEPRFRTEARVAYDSRYLYVFVRAFDSRPDSIVGLLTRRDMESPSDQVTVMIDSYHDRRTGYEFGVNPAGVKVDVAISRDGNEDYAWDGIWDVATRIDSVGWTAEYRLPLSQLRFTPSASNTFGIAIWRNLQRNTEQSSWPLYRVSRTGLVSQFGELTGLDGLPSPLRPEIAPYVVAKNVSVPDGADFSRGQRFSAGADFKLPLASSLRLTGTINPDFGQVEADPATLNLSAFESFFSERRPFFVEGTGLFRVNVNCSAVNCNNEQLFYSRRIGRSPHLSSQYGDINSSTASTILGAVKLTGQPTGGLTIGVIDAVTQRETGAHDATIEPATNYSVVRATQDFNGGASGIGVMFTGVNRDLDRWSASLLRRDAYTGALEFRHQFLGRRYELSGSLDFSRVSGSASSIAATQLDAVHLYQRPDGPLHFDSTRTSLSGDAEEIRFAKISGARVMFETSYLRRSAGFELNDIGYLRQADQQNWNNWMGLSFNKPNSVYRSLRWNFNWWQVWSAAGLPIDRAANTNIHTQFQNRWWLHAGGTIGQLGATWCDRCARGGPAVRQSAFLSPWLGIQGDNRNKITPSLWINYSRAGEGRNVYVNYNPQLTFNLSARLSANVGANFTRNRSDNQWYGAFTDAAGATHYTFVHLEQQTTSFTLNLGYTFTPTLTLQWYAAPFVSRGVYSNLREIDNPASASFAGRYKPYTDTAAVNHVTGFDAKQFNSNMVLRWEYLPGSTLFLVWAQGRSAFDQAPGADGVRGDLRDLFRLRADNTFLVKVSYWITR